MYALAFYGGYIIVMSMITFMLMAYDKKQAKKKRQRIPERKLLAYGAAGGAVGQWLSMHYLRHKTQHRVFVLGVPFFVAIHIAIGLIMGFLMLKGGL